MNAGERKGTLVKVKKILVGNSISYKLVEKHFCCEKFISSNVIKFNSDYDSFDTISDKFSAKLVENTSFFDGEDSFDAQRCEKIDFCPFCGSPIVVEVVETENLSEQYNSIKVEIEKVKLKMRNTDSKSQESLLRAEMLKMQSEMNSMYENDIVK